MKPTLLVVDDDSTFLNSIAFAFKDIAHVVLASSVAECEIVFHKRNVDLVIADYQMTNGDGHEVVALARKLPSIPPVIMVTAYADKEMAIRSVNLHVYALLEKPIDLIELTGLVNQALQNGKAMKVDNGEVGHPVVTSGGLVLDPADFSVKYQGKNFVLTETEFNILFFLVGSAGKRVAREQIIQNVWGVYKASPNLFDTHLGNLKKKIPSLKRQIKSVRGRGYIFDEVES